jgi:hypothetical protein
MKTDRARRRTLSNVFYTQVLQMIARCTLCILRHVRASRKNVIDLREQHRHEALVLMTWIAVYTYV